MRNAPEPRAVEIAPGDLGGCRPMLGPSLGPGLEQALRAALTAALDGGDYDTAAGLVGLLKARSGGR